MARVIVFVSRLKKKRKTKLVLGRLTETMTEQLTTIEDVNDSEAQTLATLQTLPDEQIIKHLSPSKIFKLVLGL